jgi:hypothetical protein
MDKKREVQPGIRFTREVRQWLGALATDSNGISVVEPDPGRFLLENQRNIRLLLSVQPLLASLPAPFEPPPDTRTITLWEDVWYTGKDIVQSRLRALLGLSQRIPARMTTLRRLDKSTTHSFLERNHLQVPVVSNYKYGLYLPRRSYRVLDHPSAFLSQDNKENELLVAVATFARPRLFERQGQTHRSAELVRFANLKNTTVVGGLDKLLQHFVREHQPDDIMTYVDLEWSDGAGYSKLGFEPGEQTPPLDFWVDPQSCKRYYPHRLPAGVTEENVAKLDYIKVQNAGSRKFVKTI